MEEREVENAICLFSERGTLLFVHFDSEDDAQAAFNVLISGASRLTEVSCGLSDLTE